MAFLQSILVNVIWKALQSIGSAIIGWVVSAKKAREQKKANEQNAATLVDSINQGASNEEIANNAEDVLNRVKHK